MAKLDVADAEIEGVESLLLPEGCHFGDEARSVIRSWESADVVACPGSGKTTMLLAKLKLLADRMPLEGGGGVCALSHTNVAVDEIKRSLPLYADRLLGYPNHVGTIQSFVDRFIVAPYLRWQCGVAVRPVDDDVFGRAVFGALRDAGHSGLANFVGKRYGAQGNQRSVAAIIGTLSIDDEGSLVDAKGKSLAGAGARSTAQFAWATDVLLRRDGIIRFRDAYRFAVQALNELPGVFPSLLSARFPYVFIDEFQDCSQAQRDILDALFDREGCCVMHLGDPDQAIYSSDGESASDWIPSQACLSINSSSRYGQDIADILSPLRADKNRIVSSSADGCLRPTLIVYDDDSRKRVPAYFARLIEENGLDGSSGDFKAIGYVGNDSSKGTSIGDYWEGYQKEGSKARLGYWDMVDEISDAISSGALYTAEPILRDLFCRILRYAGYTEFKSGKKLTVASVRDLLGDDYRTRFLELSTSEDKSPSRVDAFVRQTLERTMGVQAANEGLSRMPAYFTQRNHEQPSEAGGRNVYVDSTFGTEIKFDTVHGVKGETHEATLYLETETHSNSDIKRVLQHYRAGKKVSNPIHNRCRKVVYVGMSRPRRLLCLAVSSDTYEAGERAFLNWEIVDLRHNSRS